jgi:hypothetical protein
VGQERLRENPAGIASDPLFQKNPNNDIWRGRMRKTKTLYIVALLVACGGKHSTNPPPGGDVRIIDGNDGGVPGGNDGGPDGGLPNDGVDAGFDGGFGDSLRGYEAALSVTLNPFASGGATDVGAPDGEADVCCTATTIMNCQIPRGEGAFSPARRLAILGIGTAPVTAKIYSDATCRTLDRTLSSDLPFPHVNLYAVQVDFTPSLPPGRHVSIQWTAGYCDPSPCIDYVIGSSPGGCWPEYGPPAAGGR